MKVSLITVCYNSAATIRGTMESVARQRGDESLEIEYIVIDGGSTDGTVDVIKKFEAARTPLPHAPNFAFRWLSEKDRGMYDALNKGIAMATGDVVGILNADDRLEDERVLLDVAKAFGEGPRSSFSRSGKDSASPLADASAMDVGTPVDAVYGDVRFVRGEGTETVRYYSSRPWRPWMHSWGYMPAHPTMYVRREVFAKFGGYKLGYDISADFEWMVRVFCKGRIRVKYVPRCMVTMRLGGKSTAGLKAMLRLNRENVRANRENGYFCCLPMMLPKYFYKIFGYARRRKRREERKD